MPNIMLSDGKLKDKVLLYLKVAQSCWGRDKIKKISTISYVKFLPKPMIKDTKGTS